VKVGEKKPSSVWTIVKNYFYETLKNHHGNTTNSKNAILKKKSKFEIFHSPNFQKNSLFFKTPF